MASKWQLSLAALLLAATAAWAGDKNCPPPYVHCMEAPPKICYKCNCPRPVCDPCNLEHWGYYPTCWRRWPGNWANCPHRSPPWVYNGPDYQVAENAMNAPQNGVPGVPQTGPALTEPAPQPPMRPMQPMQPNLEEAPAPRPINPAPETPLKYEGASPVGKRPKLAIYASPHGN